MNRFNFNPLEKYPGISTSDTPSPFAKAVIEWGRNSTHAPYLDMVAPESLEPIRAVQQELALQYPDAELIDKIHATILYCQPQYLLNTLCKIRGINPTELKPAYEATFYSDISAAIDATTIFRPRRELDIGIESLEIFNRERGTVVLKLADSAFTGYYRQQTRLLMVRNLEMFHGVTPDEEAQLREDPKLMWLFQDSIPHITLAHGISDDEEYLSSVKLPESVSLDTIDTDMPFAITAAGSLLFPIED